MVFTQLTRSLNCWLGANQLTAGMLIPVTVITAAFKMIYKLGTVMADKSLREDPIWLHVRSRLLLTVEYFTVARRVVESVGGHHGRLVHGSYICVK
jgi:hypothetical protein